jgi:hypothetical protein
MTWTDPFPKATGEIFFDDRAHSEAPERERNHTLRMRYADYSPVVNSQASRERPSDGQFVNQVRWASLHLLVTHC